MIKSTCHVNHDEELPGEDESFVTMDTTSMLLHSIVNTEAKEMIRSIGGLLLFLTTFLGKDHFEGDNPTLSIHSFISIDLDKYMSIDRVTNHISFHSTEHTSESRYLHDSKSSFFSQRHGQREAGFYYL